MQQFEQRKVYEQDLSIVEILAKYARYQEVFAEQIEAKARKNILDQEVKELEAKNKPFKDSKE